MDAPKRIAIHWVTLGPFATNCYIVRVEGSKGCWIVDAGYEPDELIDRVRAEGLTPRAIVLTHAHPDHIAGVRDVLAAFPGTPIWVHRAEREWLVDPELNLSTLIGIPVTAPKADRVFDGGEELELEGTRWRVLHTPGHSPGGIALFERATGILFSGDIVYDGPLIEDCPGADADDYARSMHRLLALPVRVLHGGHFPSCSGDRLRGLIEAWLRARGA